MTAEPVVPDVGDSGPPAGYDAFAVVDHSDACERVLFLYRKVDTCMSDATPDLSGTQIAPGTTGMSEARRKSIRLHLTGIQTGLFGLSVLTLVVVVVYLSAVTLTSRLRVEYESWRHPLIVAWGVGFAMVAIGRLLCMFDVRGNERRGLPMATLVVDLLGLTIWYLLAVSPRANPMLGFPAYFLASAMHAAYLGHIADIFHLPDLGTTVKRAVLTNLAAGGAWIFVFSFVPNSRGPVDTGYRMFVTLTCMLSLGAHVMQIMLLSRFGSKAARRLQAERQE